MQVSISRQAITQITIESLHCEVSLIFGVVYRTQAALPHPSIYGSYKMSAAAARWASAVSKLGDRFSNIDMATNV